VKAENQWSLFGIDLSQAAGQVALAWRQLTTGDESGVYRQLADPVRLLPANGSAPVVIREVGDTVEMAAAERDSLPLALELPEELVLVRRLQLPTAAESELESAVFLDASANSPFPSEDLRLGWRIASREGHHLTVDIAMVSYVGLMNWLRHNHPERVDGDRPYEVWAQASGHYIVIAGFSESARQDAYQRRLQVVGLRAAAVMLLAIVTLSIPVWATQWRAQHLEGMVEQVRGDARAATRLREALDGRREKVLALQALTESRQRYDLWGDWLADNTPDSVHLQTLEFAGHRADLSGLADNAAGYLTELASADVVESVESTSAFTRERNTGKERFAIRVTLPGASDD
jgi:general secretion pathway protein L